MEKKGDGDFTASALEVVSKIPEGVVMTYGQVAAAAGRSGAARAVGTIMKKNWDTKVPCFRVVRGDGTVGAYNRGAEQKKRLLRKEGSLDGRGRIHRYFEEKKPVSRDRYIEILQNGEIGVLATDTIYGLVCRAEDRRAVERVYALRKRDLDKACIMLIASAEEMKRFGVRFDTFTKRVAHVVWPGPVSAVLPCDDDRWAYLHRGTKSLAFRVPGDSDLRKLLKQTGPLIAPSANLQNTFPAETIDRAREYFGGAVVAWEDAGRLHAKPSTLIACLNHDIVLKREGRIPFRSIVQKMQRQ